MSAVGSDHKGGKQPKVIYYGEGKVDHKGRKEGNEIE